MGRHACQHHPLARLATRLAAWTGLACCLGGCLSDQVADHAIAYNIASEQAHDREMLLNIVRASERRPLEFTDVQSISATSSRESNTEIDIPISQNGAEDALSLVQHLNLSDRPTFQVSVLDTQEFYQGVLRPLSTQTFDFYLKRNVPRRLLFDLFFSSVTVKAANHRDGTAPFAAEFDNDPTDDARIDDFQALIEALLDAGLTAVSIPPRSASLGPPLTPDEVVRDDLAIKAAHEGAQLKPTAWCGLEPAELDEALARLVHDARRADRLRSDCAAAGRLSSSQLAWLRATKIPTVLYRLQKTPGQPSVTLCIPPRSGAAWAEAGEQAECAVSLRKGDDGGESGLRLDLAAASPTVCATLNRHRVSGRLLDCGGQIYVEFIFAARSTYEIIRYLGEVVRREANPDTEQSRRVILVKMDPPAPLAPPRTAGDPDTCRLGASIGSLAADGSPCRPIFMVQRGKPPHGSFAGVKYQGQEYFVPSAQPTDPAGEPTFETLQLLTELIALNRSAKDTPASTVFTIVAP
jgi:hypothetical protein